jgi:hypothetical protein
MDLTRLFTIAGDFELLLFAIEVSNVPSQAEVCRVSATNLMPKMYHPRMIISSSMTTYLTSPGPQHAG